VPQSTVPGERTAPTQPIPTKPPPFDLQGATEENLIDFTPQLRAEAVEILNRYTHGPLFTPPSIRDDRSGGNLGTIELPGSGGGPNWTGGAVDPDTGILYVPSATAPFVADIEPGDASVTNLRYVKGTRLWGPAGPRGLPLFKPPYGRITALDMNKGTLAWQIAHGETPDNIKNHPALKGVDIPRTGRQGRIGVLVTKNLVIAGEGGFATTPTGQRGAMLRAYDKATGADVGAVYMPAPQTGSPMTYFYNGKQYIVVAISGASYSGELLAFKLP